MQFPFHGQSERMFQDSDFFLDGSKGATISERAETYSATALRVMFFARSGRATFSVFRIPSNR